jgi:hypothetical protein
MLKNILFVLFSIGLVGAHECRGHDCEPCETICLSNGLTLCYSEYEYLKEQQKISPDVYILNRGDCHLNYSSKCLCCLEYPQNPVCGTDSVTYHNVCELVCVAKTNYGLLNHLGLLHMGPCRPTEN